jgi:hypothetical protein
MPSTAFTVGNYRGIMAHRGQWVEQKGERYALCFAVSGMPGKFVVVGMYDTELAATRHCAEWHGDSVEDG